MVGLRKATGLGACVLSSMLAACSGNGLGIPTGDTSTASSHATASQMGSSQGAPAGPGGSGPPTPDNQPTANDPPASAAIWIHPLASEPSPSDPTPSNPAPSNPTPSNPTPSDPSSSNPTSSDPAPAPSAPVAVDPPCTGGDLAVAFSVIDVNGSGVYAPQVRVHNCSASVLYPTKLELWFPDGTPVSPINYCTSVAPGASRDLFVECYGDYDFEMYLPGRSAGAGPFDMKLTYVDVTQQATTLGFETPSVVGGLPTTYSGDEKLHELWDCH